MAAIKDVHVKDMPEVDFVYEGSPKDNKRRPKKTSFASLYKNLITNFKKTDVVIIAGEFAFNCHRLILMHHSEYFRNLIKDDRTFCLPEKYVKCHLLVSIYDWMLSRKNIIEKDNVVELYIAIKFLQIKELEQELFVALDDKDFLIEIDAFMVYLRAKELKEPFLTKMMINRVVKSFLIIVSTVNFENMSIDDVCKFLSLNTIAVHSEIEILYAGFRWLHHDWKARRKFSFRIIHCVRFLLFAPSQLTQFNKVMAFGDSKYAEVFNVLNHTKVQNIIRSSLSYITSLFVNANLDGKPLSAQLLERLELPPPVSRTWLDYAILSHLRAKTLHIGFEAFLEYLEILKEDPPKAMAEFKCIDYPSFSQFMPSRDGPKPHKI